MYILQLNQLFKFLEDSLNIFSGKIDFTAIIYLVLAFFGVCEIIFIVTVLMREWKAIAFKGELMNLIYEMKIDVESNRKLLASLENLVAKNEEDMSQIITSTMAQANKDNYTKLFQDITKKSLPKMERNEYATNQKLDILLCNVAKISERIEMTSKYMHEKSIQTETKAEKVDIPSAPLLAKKKLKESSLKKEECNDFNKSIATTIKKSLMEFKEEANMMVSKTNKDRDFIRLYEDFSQQIVQSSSHIENIIREAYIEMNLNYEKVMKRLTLLHNDTRQQMLEPMKDSLDYVSKQHAEIADDIKNKLNVSSETLQNLVSNYVDIQKLSQNILAITHLIMEKMSTNKILSEQGDSTGFPETSVLLGESKENYKMLPASSLKPLIPIITLDESLNDAIN